MTKTTTPAPDLLPELQAMLHEQFQLGWEGGITASAEMLRALGHHDLATIVASAGSIEGSPAPKKPRTTCLEPVWLDGASRARCGMGTAGRCATHGDHRPHPSDGRVCKPNPSDGYCHTHGVYMAPTSAPCAAPSTGDAPTPAENLLHDIFAAPVEGGDSAPTRLETVEWDDLTPEQRAEVQRKRGAGDSAPTCDHRGVICMKGEFTRCACRGCCSRCGPTAEPRTKVEKAPRRRGGYPSGRVVPKPPKPPSSNGPGAGDSAPTEPRPACEGKPYCDCDDSWHRAPALPPSVPGTADDLAPENLWPNKGIRCPDSRCTGVIYDGQPCTSGTCEDSASSVPGTAKGGNDDE